MGVRNDAIKIASKKGYLVSECGEEVSYKGKLRKLQIRIINDKPYKRFSIHFEGRAVNIMVHRLQAYQKYRNKVFQYNIVVRHKNDNSLDNSKKNILIGTQSQNMRDKYRNKY